jgi:uncharacterized protein YcfL
MKYILLLGLILSACGSEIRTSRTDSNSVVLRASRTYNPDSFELGISKKTGNVNIPESIEVSGSTVNHVTSLSFDSVNCFYQGNVFWFCSDGLVKGDSVIVNNEMVLDILTSNENTTAQVKVNYL